jgi:hypothetical protein
MSYQCECKNKQVYVYNGVCAACLLPLSSTACDKGNALSDHTFKNAIEESRMLREQDARDNEFEPVDLTDLEPDDLSQWQSFDLEEMEAEYNRGWNDAIKKAVKFFNGHTSPKNTSLFLDLYKKKMEFKND